LNSGVVTCKAGTLPLELQLYQSPAHSGYFRDGGQVRYLPWLAST
jgi:hypothetical protein